MLFRSIGGRLGGKRLGWRQLLAGYFRLWHRPLHDGPYRLAGFPVEGIEKRLLGGLEYAGDYTSIYRDIHQQGCGGGVVVPDIVMHHLEVPTALSGGYIERDQAGTEEVISGLKAAIKIDCGRIGWYVDDAPLGIG